jgi:hypothetical protein
MGKPTVSGPYAKRLLRLGDVVNLGNLRAGHYHDAKSHGNDGQKSKKEMIESFIEHWPLHAVMVSQPPPDGRRSNLLFPPDACNIDSSQDKYDGHDHYPLEKEGLEVNAQNDAQ